VRPSSTRRRYVSGQTSSFETMQGIQRFLAARNITSVDHPSLALPDSARQFLVHTKVERAVGNQVWHHEHPWVGHGVGRWRVNLWGGDGDERHLSRAGDCRRVESEVEKTICVVLGTVPKATGILYSF
jgi:hypothetical protein